MDRINILTLSIITVFFLHAAHGQSIHDITAKIREGRIQEAKALLIALEKTNPDKDYILFLHGLVSVNGDSATRYYNDLLTKYPKSSYCDDARFRIGQYRYVRGLYKQAREDFSQILKIHQDSPLRFQAHYWIGLCFQATNQTDSAHFRFQKVKDLSGSDDLIQLASQAQENTEPNESVQTNPATKVPAIRYAVQVGAFSRQTNALLRKSFFESKGYQVDLRTKTKDNVLLYLVWIGTFPSAEEARQFGMELKSKYGVKYTIASEEN